MSFPATPQPSVTSNAGLDMTADATAGTPDVASRDMESKADGLRYEHPDYVTNCAKWKKYNDCYEANDIYNYIKQHPRESDDMFVVRVGRGYYYNYCASVIDLFVAYLFHAPITRDPKTLQDVFQEIYENADLAGNKYIYFIQSVATFAQISGFCGVLVDAPKASDNLVTEADRKRQGIRPYLTSIRAEQIKDWELDKQGNFVWVKLEINRPEPDRQWGTKVDQETRNFVIWTREGWEEWSLKEEEATKIDEGTHSLGVVPLVIVKNEKLPGHTWFGASALRDIADINLAILNWSSLGDEEIAERCLNILTMETDGSDAPAILTHHNVLGYAPGASPPQYLQPGTTPLELIGKWIDRAKDEIYRLAKLGGSTGLLGVREATSGIAYAYEFNETNQSLARKAESLEQAEIEIHRLCAKWLQKDFEGSIIYPKEFGVDDFLTEFQILAEARANLTSETAVKEIEKKLSAKLFARDSMKLRSTISKEIEDSKLPVLQAPMGFGNVPGAMVQEPNAQQPGSPSSSADNQSA